MKHHICFYLFRWMIWKNTMTSNCETSLPRSCKKDRGCCQQSTVQVYLAKESDRSWSVAWSNGAAAPSSKSRSSGRMPRRHPPGRITRPFAADFRKRASGRSKKTKQRNTKWSLKMELALKTRGMSHLHHPHDAVD